MIESMNATVNTTMAEALDKQTLPSTAPQTEAKLGTNTKTSVNIGVVFHHWRALDE